MCLRIQLWMWNMYCCMKLPYFHLKIRLLFRDLFWIHFWIRIQIRIQNVYFCCGSFPRSGQKFWSSSRSGSATPPVRSLGQLMDFDSLIGSKYSKALGPTGLFISLSNLNFLVFLNSLPLHDNSNVRYSLGSNEKTIKPFSFLQHCETGTGTWTVWTVTFWLVEPEPQLV